MRFAAVVCTGLLLLATSGASARGPGGGPGSKPGKSEGGSGLAERLKANQNGDAVGKADKLELAELHPTAARALNATGSLNPATAGATPLAGKLAMAQGGGQGYGHQLGEIIGFLEMAKHSSDPQLAAKA